MHENELARTAQQVADRIDKLDRELLDIAAQSQLYERSTLPAGANVPERGKRTVVGAAWEQEAKDATARASQDVRGYVDAIIDRANSHVTENATAEELANVSFVLDRGNVTDEELMALYDRYKGKWSIARVIRREAAKRHIPLHSEPGDSLLEHADELRTRAANATAGRWYPAAAAYANRAVVTPAGIIADDLLDCMRGVDVFGTPLY